jgi:branched-subunit amino acid aminotransferase/4-amino-4-deoxychorismate lyase
VSGERLWWPGLAPGDGEAGDPLVIDSWLVSEGAGRAADLHEERFRRSCAAILPGLDGAELQRFLAAARSAFPAGGRWFPRLEAYPGCRLALWLRPAPPPATEARLWVPPEPDPRRRPEVKGPDLRLLAALRAEARSYGADDALLWAPDGTVLEAAHAALLWWRDGVLCAPDPRLPTLPSVTRSLLLGMAAERGVTVRRERIHLHDLDGLEVWAVNALHGVRKVVGWRRAWKRQEGLGLWGRSSR